MEQASSSFSPFEAATDSDALKRRLEVLEALVNHIPALVSYVNHEQRYLYANQRYEDWLGLAPDQLIGHTVAEVAPTPALYEAIRPNFERALRGELVDFEVRVDYKNAGTRWVQVQYVPDSGPAGEVRGVFVLVTDIEDRKQLEEMQDDLLAQANDTANALKRANETKDDFLGMISHELRSPLTVILGNSQLLMRNPDLLQPHERRATVVDTYREAVRLGNIVENLMTLARFDRGQSVELEPVLLRRVCSRVIHEFSRASGRHYETNFHRPMMLAQGNVTCIEQVLRNLLSNAEKYSPPNTAIEISTEVTDGEEILSVADHGVGIPASEAEHVFEPFYRSSNATGRAGMGVGLAVARQLVDAMQGRIWCEPRPEGGTVFRLALRVSDEEPQEFP